MTPEIRAIADRFIMDTANLKYLASGVSKDALERPVEVLGWTVRQAIGHLVVWQEAYVDVLPVLLRGDELDPNFDINDFNAEGAEQTRQTPLPELIGRLDLALVRLIALLEQLPAGLEEAPAGPARFIDLLRGWSLHLAEHGIDLVDALPELRFDPMILNWVLYVDYSDDSRRLGRQQALLADVRDHFVDEDEAFEEDEDES